MHNSPIVRAVSLYQRIPKSVDKQPAIRFHYPSEFQESLPHCLYHITSPLRKHKEYLYKQLTFLKECDQRLRRTFVPSRHACMRMTKRQPRIPFSKLWEFYSDLYITWLELQFVQKIYLQFVFCGALNIGTCMLFRLFVIVNIYELRQTIKSLKIFFRFIK